MNNVLKPYVLRLKLLKSFSTNSTKLCSLNESYLEFNYSQENSPRPTETHSYTPYVSEILSLDENLPKKTCVAIGGGGIFGISLAYHLAELGWGEKTLIIEQGRLGGATSWRGSGFLGAAKLSGSERTVFNYSLQLAKDLQSKGFDVGWKQCGSLHLTRTPERLIHLRRIIASAEALGEDCSLLNKTEIFKKCDILHTEDLVGGLWEPNDGVCDLYKLCMTLIQLAREKGVQIVENCSINRIRTKNQKVTSLQTSKGSVECEIFVNAAGTWARKIGKMTEPLTNIPIHAAQTHYLYTRPADGIDDMMPAIRDPDGSIYMREYNGGIMGGYFPKWAKPAFERGNLPEKWHLRELAPDWDHFQPALEELLHRVPILSNAVLDTLHNSADGYSPDGKWIVGKVPEFRNYFVAAGLKSSGSNSATGVGRMMAEWLVHDHPPMDTYGIDILRFLPSHNNNRYLRDRVQEVPGFHYNVEFPFADFETGRCVRMPPIFPKLKAAGAVFRQVLGYERPSYYITDETNSENHKDEVPFRPAFWTSWTKPASFDYTAKEYEHCRQHCAIHDYSSFSKIELWSKDLQVVPSLEYLCSNSVDIPVGSICHTGMQNKMGGYENDCSLARIAPNHYMMIAPSVLQARCMNWFNLNLPRDGSVVTRDVTSMYTALCVMGPKARDVLSEISDTDFTLKGFPFFTFKEIDVGLASGIRALNLTHTGEVGWVLYIPNEYALHVYENLVSVGEKYGLIHAGYNAMRSLRVEKFFAFWGQDLGLTVTPLECGRVFRTKLDKDVDFLGRSALEKQKLEGVKRLFVHFTLDDHNHEIDYWPCGEEPIFRNGKIVGVTTTTSYGYTLQKMVCLGFVHNVDSKENYDIVTPEYIMEGDYEISIAGVIFQAKPSLRSPSLPNYGISDKNRYVATRL